MGKQNKRVFSQEEKDEIVAECLETLVSPNELGKKYGATADTIRGWIKKAGKELPKNYKRTVVKKTDG